MPIFRKVSVIEQTAAHLREGVRTGRWKARLPGMRPLARELAVGIHAVRAAIRILVQEGALAEGEAREAYTIVVSLVELAPPERTRLRVAILTNGALANKATNEKVNILGVIADVRDQGHECFVVSTPEGKDPHKTGYLAKIVEVNEADAWVVYNGNLETLRWFESKGIPTLAMGGRSEESTLACATFCLEGALRQLVQRLTTLGHRRIVMISPKSLRHPHISPLLHAFRDELEKVGVKLGEFHTPDWDETPAGLLLLIDSLFKITPPTAVICWHANSPFGTLSWLIGRRLKVPEEVSFFSLNDDSSFRWLLPGLTVAHIKHEELIPRRRVRKWLDCVATKSPPPLGLMEGAILHPGDTLGPAKPEST